MALPDVGPGSQFSARFPAGCFIAVIMARSLRFQPPPVKPYMRFSRTRLSDAVHRRHSALPANPEGRGSTTVPDKMIGPGWFGVLSA